MKFDKISLSLGLLTLYSLLTWGNISLYVLDIIGLTRYTMYPIYSLILIFLIIFIHNKGLLVYQRRIILIGFLLLLFFILHSFSFYYPFELFDRFTDIIMSITYFLVVFYVVSKIKNIKQIQSGLCLLLVFSGLIEWVVQSNLNAMQPGLCYGNPICLIGINPPVYMVLALMIIFFNNKLIFNIIFVLSITIFIFGGNRSGLVTISLVYLCSTKLFDFILLKKYKIYMFFGVLISTLITGLFEYQVPGKGIGDGRGDIWGFWIYSLLENPINLIFGFGARDGTQILNLSEIGDATKATGFTDTFHSGIVNVLATGGIIQLILLYLIILFSINNDKDPLKSALYYYSLTMISVNAYGSFFGPQLIYLLFSISLFAQRIQPFLQISKTLIPPSYSAAVSFQVETKNYNKNQ
jgi:hypothetical protein